MATLDGPTRLAVRQPLEALGAIAAIQARLTGAAPGQLGLADDEAGMRSLAGSPAGEVALVPSGEALEGSTRAPIGPPESGCEPEAEESSTPAPRPDRKFTTN